MSKGLTLITAISGENSQCGIHRFRRNFQIIFRKEPGYGHRLQPTKPAFKKQYKLLK
jgi:hypothetical protein